MKAELNIDDDSNKDNKIIIFNEKNIENEEELEEPKSSLLNLPDYLIETYIFPYLTWKELFFAVRGTNSYLHEIVKSTWCNIIKEEMCNQLKNLTYLYEKDALTKAYEFKYQYLINYRNLLLVYYLNANILVSLETCLDYLQDQHVFKLLATFFGISGQEQCLNLLFEENSENENKKNKIIELLRSEQLIEDFKGKMEIILDIDSIESDEQIFKELNDDYNSIDREHVEEIHENCRLVYSFLQGILEYQNLKKNIQELKMRLKQLYIKIQVETSLWPKRKKFFETAYKILLYSKPTTYKFRFMNNLYIKYSVKSPFCEYKEESFNSMIELRDKMEIKKKQMQEKLEKNDKNITKDDLMEEVNDLLLKNVLDRRLLLSKKILLTEKFYDLINDGNSKCKKENNGQSYIILGEAISTEELLKTLVLVSHVCPEDISIESVLKLFKIKKDLEEEQMKENINNKGMEIITKNEALNIEKRSEIILLKKQKENLINQKKKTEQMLNVLKKYMTLKENFLKNKQKYKSTLFILSKMRQKNNNRNIINDGNEESIDKIEKILESQNSEINLNELSNEEKEELKNFEVSENLLKDIESSLMLKIKKLFEDEKNENLIDNDNDTGNDEMKENCINTSTNINSNINNNENNAFSQLGIKNEINLNICGGSINIEHDDNQK
jgi:hypothetical protein